MKVCKTIKKAYRAFLRKKLNKQNAQRLKNCTFTIISSNCLGGVLYHELGMEFRSPTINTGLYPKDFIKFCSSLEDYLQITPIPYENAENVPAMLLGDIVIFCPHVQNAEEAIACWERRKTRINFRNICFILCDRDGCTEEDVLSFSRLPYENKIAFVRERFSNCPNAVYVPGTEAGDGEHGIVPLTGYIGRWSGKRQIDKFDYVSFFNEMKRNEGDI